MAALYTEQRSVDVKDSITKRAEYKKIKINDPKARDWFTRSLKAKVCEGRKQTE